MDCIPFWVIYWKSVIINILGFVPLGFFVFACLSREQKGEHSAAITVTVGFVISLVIEVLQSFLPTRDSGMTDLITNTLGTAIGVLAFKYGVQAALSGAAVSSPLAISGAESYVHPSSTL